MSTVTQDCRSLLTTSKALIEQFSKSLNATSISDGVNENTEHPPPLQLSKVAAESVKSTTTKLSLLSITAPYTESAVASVLKPLNDSILPSLVTAALHVTPTLFPTSFATESRRLTSSILSELSAFLVLVEQRAHDVKRKTEPKKEVKQTITEATGRVWEACDTIVAFSKNGVPGFIVKKTEQWLALMKDAVAELTEWDPSEDVDEDIFGDADSDDETSTKATDKSGDDDQALIAAGVKDQALKVLSRIPQACHVVIKQRLAKMPPLIGSGEQLLTGTQKLLLESVVHKMRTVSECIDESAEGLYMGNPELCLKKAGEARALTIEIVESVMAPWQPDMAGTDAKEDVFIKRALVWIEQVDTGSPNAVTAS